MGGQWPRTIRARLGAYRYTIGRARYRFLVLEGRVMQGGRAASQCGPHCGRTMHARRFCNRYTIGYRSVSFYSTVGAGNAGWQGRQPMRARLGACRYTIRRARYRWQVAARTARAVSVQPATELRIFDKRRVAADNALRTLAVVVHPLGPSTGTAQKYLPPEGRWPSVREVG